MADEQTTDAMGYERPETGASATADVPSASADVSRVTIDVQPQGLKVTVQTNDGRQSQQDFKDWTEANSFLETTFGGDESSEVQGTADPNAQDDRYETVAAPAPGSNAPYLG